VNGSLLSPLIQTHLATHDAGCITSRRLKHSAKDRYPRPKGRRARDRSRQGSGLRLDRSCPIPHVVPKIRATPVAHFRIQRACSSSAFLPSTSCSVPTPATSTLLLLPTEQSAPLSLLLALLCLSTRLTAARAHWWLTHRGWRPLAAARRLVWRFSRTC